MLKDYLHKIVFLATLMLLPLMAVAQTIPQVGRNYYIAAQTWDGSKYVERFLYLSGNYVYQTTDLARASVWNALNPTYGSGIGLRTGGKFLMRGGISSASWGSIIAEPTVTTSDPPAGSLTLKSTVTNYQYYIIAPNAGGGFTAVNAATESSYQPKTSLYTPYFKFYDAAQPIVAVKEVLTDSNETNIGASYVFIPHGRAPVGGNVWPAEPGTITIDNGSYNHLFYTFAGFRVGASSELVESVSTDNISSNTSISAVFTPNSLEDEQFTFISSNPSWYTNQQVYKAVYLDTSDNLLKWKTYDPADDAFYFKAHGSFDNLAFESVISPGNYISGATTPVAQEGTSVELRPLGAGDYNIVANSQCFFTNGHNNGRNVSGNISNATGASGSEAAWWIQSANDKTAETTRYQNALNHEAEIVAEAQRQTARNNLLQAINNVVVGEGMGNVPADAYELALSTYQNNTLSAADYTNAITLLYSSCRVPAVGTKWRVINSANNGQVMSVNGNGGLVRSGRRSSLYQMWTVEAVHFENPTQLSFRNLGSDTYMACNTNSSSSPTITTDAFSYVNLNAVSPGVFSIEVLGRSDQYIYLATSPYGNAIIVQNSGAWRFEEVPESELDQLTADEDSRKAKRQELADLIADVRTMCSNAGAIGYYSTLVQALSAAQSIYDDVSCLTSEYQTGINNLQNAVKNAQYSTPDSNASYIICDHNGLIAMKLVDNAAMLDTYDNTNREFFWKLSAVPRIDDNLLPSTQRFTLTSVDGTNTVRQITAQLIGNNDYYITIDGDQAWNAAYANTPISIHKAEIDTHHAYLTDDETYRIRSAVTGKVLSRNEQWVARVSVETPDRSLTNWDQIWRVETQPGADRYRLVNVGSGRYIEEQMTGGSQITAANTPGTWHLKPTDVEGEFQVLTTMAPIDQLAIGYNGDKAVAADQNAAGTSWIFDRVTPLPKPSGDRQVYKIINRYATTATVTDYLYALNNSVGHSCGKNASYYTNDINQKWTLAERDSINSDGSLVLDANGQRIHLAEIQNVYSSKYVTPQNYSNGNGPANPFKASDYPYSFRMLEYNDPSTGQSFTVFKNPFSEQYLAVNTSVTTVDRLAWVADINNKAAHWTLQALEGEIMNEEAILDRNDSMYGYIRPEDGAAARIVTSNESTCLEENYKQNILQHKTIDDRRYAQFWRMHLNPVNGLYKFENIYTGNYIVNSSASNNTLTTTPDVNKAGEFAVALNRNITATRQYNILDAIVGLSLNSANTNIAANGNPSERDEATTAEFRFMIPMDKNRTPYTEDDFAKMRRKYIEDRDIMKYVTKYDDILGQLFVDRACTTLRSDLTEETIEAALDNLPEILVDMVEKILNDSWPEYRSGTNWDRMFRIREYPVVSNANFGGVIRCAYNFSALNEPVGILAHPGDVIAVMVESAPKPGATLALDLVEGLNRTGSSRTTLKQGLNIIQIAEEGNLFINYMINSTANTPDNYISNFPDIKIHVEGGEVYGCINRVHGPGATVQEADDLWVRMQQDGLIKNGPMAQVVGESIMLNFNSYDMTQGCPVKIGEVIDMWDSWIKIQQWVMGLRDRQGNKINDYIPNLKERWNNRWGAFERTGGFMNANGGGAQYSTSTIRGLVNYNSLVNSGCAWGPVHEHGHDHQTVINMCGMTEVSNNLFSNINTREGGAVVSRGTSLPDAASVYARGGNWFDNNIWTMTQMYFKLYLYYHVAGNKPTFYPEVFAKLRANPLLHSASVAVPADRDYLQFAKVCSEVAGEDLSEFFEAYGMLRPLTPEYSLNGAASFEDFKGQYCRIVGDYSTYHVYTTDQMIADAKEFMASCGPKNGNIMFIDDRIRWEPAAHSVATPGQMRAERSDGGRIGAFGDVGMWDDFTAENQNCYATGCDITKEWSANGVTLHINGQGAVGYKIYGPDGELVYFSAFNDILIPTVILNKYDISDLVVVAAQADGTSVEITNEADTKYTVTTYRNGSQEGISTYSTGRFEPELRGNDVCVVESTSGLSFDDFAFQGTDNVILKDGDNHSMQRLSLTDGYDFYIPADVNIETAVYRRPDTEGWNGLCLPFAVSESDFGSGAKIYTLHSTQQENGEFVLNLVRKYQVGAGEPCFVLCEPKANAKSKAQSQDSGWEIEVNDTRAAAIVTPTESLNGSIRINGSYTNEPMGAGSYTLNNDDNSFGAAAETDTNQAFRSYIEATDISAPSFRLRIVQRSTTGVDEVIIDRKLDNDVIYDLSGRRLAAPIHGQPYILNGRVYYGK